MKTRVGSKERDMKVQFLVCHRNGSPLKESETVVNGELEIKKARGALLVVGLCGND